MNNTATYISDLLYRYECVIIPGFGAFLTKRQAASIQESTHGFFPPQKLISFNSQLQNNDGLLANYIAEVEHISYTDAVAKIQRYVLSLNNKMALGQRIELDGIGYFYTSIENTLQFEPLQEVNYLTEAFGLNSFISPSIIREKAASDFHNVFPQTNTRKIYKEQTEAIEEQTPIAFTPERRAQKQPYYKYAAIAAVTIGVVGLLGLNRINNTNKNFNDNLLVETNQEIQNKIQEATFEIANPLPAVNITTIKKSVNNASSSNINEATKYIDKYHIVAGAFRIKANANNKVKQLTNNGFDAQLIGINKYGLHQVAYASFSNREDAVNSLRKIKQKENPKAWLLIEK